jgi:hypothetical protein
MEEAHWINSGWGQACPFDINSAGPELFHGAHLTVIARRPAMKQFRALPTDMELEGLGLLRPLAMTMRGVFWLSQFAQHGL